MIGTIEALGVFLLAVLPGVAGLRLLTLGPKPQLEKRGAFEELTRSIAWSTAAWTVLIAAAGTGRLATVLDDGESVGVRLDAFTELFALALAAGLALAVAARSTGWFARMFVAREGPEALRAQVAREGVVRALAGRVRRFLVGELQDSALPQQAWDRLLIGLSNHPRTLLCRVATIDGREVLGVLANEAYADWAADGRNLLLMPEVARLSTGELRPLPNSRGVFVAGEKIAHMSVVELPADQVPSRSDA